MISDSQGFNLANTHLPFAFLDLNRERLQITALGIFERRKGANDAHQGRRLDARDPTNLREGQGVMW
jgi:hypothetical protein